MKTAQDYLAEANAVVPKIAVEEAIARHTAGAAALLMSATAAILPRPERLQALCTFHGDLSNLPQMKRHLFIMPR